MRKSSSRSEKSTTVSALIPERLTRRRRKEIASLAHRKYREQLGQVVIEGVRSVEAAVSAGAPLIDLVVSESRMGDERVQALMQQASVPVFALPADEFGRFSEVQTSQGVLAVARTDLAQEERLFACRSILVLDAVQDPGNVGALMRTAAWFGVDAVVAAPGTADFFNPKAVRAAMGGLWDVALLQTEDLSSLIDRLRSTGFACYGADLSGESAVSWSPSLPSILVLGSEAHGLSKPVQGQLDGRVAIAGSPRRAGVESLNVAVAAGILIYQWMVRDAVRDV